jgi:hypothetical protein
MNSFSRRARSRRSSQGLCSALTSYQRPSSLGRHGAPRETHFPLLVSSPDDAPRAYRRVVRTQLRKGSPSDRVEKVLALLIESGFVYCLLWVFAFWPFHGSLAMTKWHLLQMFYLLSAFSILPGAGSYIVNLGMLFMSVRTLGVVRTELL